MGVNVDSLGGLPLLRLLHRFGQHLWFKLLLTRYGWQHESLESYRFLRLVRHSWCFTKSVRDLRALHRLFEFDVNIFLLTVCIEVRSR